MATSNRAQCTIGPTGTVGRGYPTGRPTQVFFVNSHCTRIQFEHDYEYPNWGQPHRGWTVGREWGDPAPRRCWKWALKWDCREADAAVIFVDPNAPFAREIALGKIARTIRRTNDYGRLSIEIHSVPTITISGVRHWNVKNEILDKVGHISGWTYGPVKKTCNDIKSTKNVIILCSDRVDYIRRGGDSGSPVFQYNNGYAQLRGIHWGGKEGKDAAMSDLEQIKKDFDRWYPGAFDQTWFYDPGPPGYPSIGGPREVRPKHECGWEADARGMSPFVYQWSGILSGTKKRVRGRVEEPGYLVVSIRDVLWREVRDSIWVSVSSEAERCSPPPPIGGDTVPPIDTLPPPPI